jgi:hypothetical protein
MNDKSLSERCQLIGTLNYWQTIKWSGSFDSLRSEIESADFSAKEDLFQLARLVLLDDFEKAIPLIEELLKNNKLPLNALEEWPIFKKIREEEQVASAIKSQRMKEREKVRFPLKPVDVQGSLVNGSEGSESV